MAEEPAAVVFTDPPYNVPIEGHVTGNGKVHHRDFAMACGEMSSLEFTGFLSTAMGNAARHTREGGLHYVCLDWRHLEEVLAAGKQAYTDLLNLCVWTKDNAGMGSFYRSQHELVLVFKHGKAPHQNHVQLGTYGRNRSNVWRYPGVNSFGRTTEEGNLLALHPTVKPVALVADALLDSSGRGDIVLDPFLGSGTTLMAAEKMGRVCRGLELDPIYVDTALRRWQALTGQEAVLAATGQRFEEVLEERQEAAGAMNEP
jgi:DNA modification methylase